LPASFRPVFWEEKLLGEKICFFLSRCKETEIAAVHNWRRRRRRRRRFIMESAAGGWGIPPDPHN
jgi:hypothetical protein